MFGKAFVRVIIPDLHGEHIDWPAANACLKDVKTLDPLHVVYMGDGLDCAGTFSTHQRNYTNEMAESYEDDCIGANRFLDALSKAAPSAKEEDYLEGNHEAHVERWASRTFSTKKDADSLLGAFGPAKVLDLKRRGIRYYKRSEHYGTAIPGCIKRGKCHFVHGVSHAQNAAEVHLSLFGANVVFGHVHTPQSVVRRIVSADGIGAYCPGTLSKLQPLYKHTAPARWAHGYAVQFVNKSGNFLHLNVPILNGVSMLREVLVRLDGRKRRR